MPKHSCHLLPITSKASDRYKPPNKSAGIRIIILLRQLRDILEKGALHNAQQVAQPFRGGWRGLGHCRLCAPFTSVYAGMQTYPSFTAYKNSSWLKSQKKHLNKRGSKCYRFTSWLRIKHGGNSHFGSIISKSKISN